MRFQVSLQAALFFLSTLICLPVGVQAEPASPKKRSFRPVVPIKQNVRGGMDQMKTQTIKLTIPPPPIPETVPLEAPQEVELEVETTKSELPPEPVVEPAPVESKADEIKTVTSTEAEKEEETTKSKPAQKDGPTLEQLRAEAHALAEQKLTYIFGADDPDSGGLDCSATIQYLLNKIGVKDVPRTSYDQYSWLKKHKLLDDVYGSKAATEKLFKKLSPGDLIFWGGTWKSGHRVSHVMLYMGYDPARDKHYIFGARGKSVKGLTGSGVDIFEFEEQKGRLIAHGKIPGLIY